ncbi:O-Antigen ligase [compost metagenome]
MSSGLLFSWLFILCGVVFVLPTLGLNASLAWHDQQRLGQIFLIGLSSAWVLVSRGGGRLDFSALWLLLGILVLAILSSALASQSLWAFTELALFIGCFSMVCMVRDFRASAGRRVDLFLWWLLVAVVIGVVFKFLVSYISALLLRGPVDSLLLFDGFSNLRFLGQFQTLGLPLLILPALVQRRWVGWGIVLCSVWWFSTIASGTRASWLGVFCAVFLIPLLFKDWKRFSLLQVVCFFIGLGLYNFLMGVVPGVLDLPTGNLAGDRLSLSMSGRESLWRNAWNMFLESPWFGAGPMNFADVAHPLGAHPHQAILQWASEWGGVSTLMIVLLLGRSAWFFYEGAKKYQKCDPPLGALKVCLMASLIASTVHAMFDGSLVMPYTQIWLAILAGWVWGIHSEQQSKVRGRFLSFQSALSILALLLLVFVAARDVPRIMTESRQDQAVQACWREAPRFWYNGIIKEKPKSGCASLQEANH